MTSRSSLVSLTASLLSITALGAGCAGRSTGPGAAPASAKPPSGWTALGGPHTDPSVPCGQLPGCKVAAAVPLAPGGAITAVTLLERIGSTPMLAFQTARGWYIEPPPPEPRDPMISHHEPRGSGYELAATRVQGDRVIVRRVEHHSVFYPGQGSAGSRSTWWSERTCRDVGGAVHCSAPVGIAHEHCNVEEVPGPATGRMQEYRSTCTGGAPKP